MGEIGGSSNGPQERQLTNFETIWQTELNEIHERCTGNDNLKLQFFFKSRGYSVGIDEKYPNFLTITNLDETKVSHDHGYIDKRLFSIENPGIVHFLAETQIHKGYFRIEPGYIEAIRKDSQSDKKLLENILDLVEEFDAGGYKEIVQDTIDLIENTFSANDDNI